MPQTRYPNALYALLAVDSTAVSATAGRSVLPLRPHLRHSGGLRVAALGLTAEHGTATFALADLSAVPIALAVSQRDIPADLDELELLTEMRHQGRSFMVTTMEAFRPGDRSQRLAFGTVTWSVLPPPAARGSATDVDAVPATSDLLEVAGITTDGTTRITTAHPGVLGPGGILHAGALQALAEEAALVAARRASPEGAPPVVTDATFAFVRAARSGPFVARAHFLSRHDIEVTIRDEDGTGRLCVLATFKVSNQ